MEIRAAILREIGAPFSVQKVELALPKSGEVLITVKAVGVCHSDWHLVTGDTKHPLPLVAGHEGAGIVEQIGDGVTKVAVGDLVSLNWAPNCGSCFYCQNVRPSLCETYVGPIWKGTMLDGTTRLTLEGKPLYHYSALACFADHCVVPEPCCVRMPEGTSAEVAALIGCAVTTGVGSVLNTAKVPAGASILIIGAGGVGLSTVLGAKLADASSISVIDPLDSRRTAAEELGAHKSYRTYKTYKADLKNKRGPDFVFEAVGKPELQELALEIVRPGGTVVLSGLSPNDSSTNLSGAKLVRQEKTVMGSYYGTANTSRDFPLYAKLWKEGKLPLAKLISHRYPLEEINEAYADMLDGTSRRGVIVFD